VVRRATKQASNGKQTTSANVLRLRLSCRHPGRTSRCKFIHSNRRLAADMFQTCSKLSKELEWLLGIIGLGSRQTGVLLICCIGRSAKGQHRSQDAERPSGGWPKQIKAGCDANVS